jgi:hypothetical protein
MQEKLFYISFCKKQGSTHSIKTAEILDAPMEKGKIFLKRIAQIHFENRIFQGCTCLLNWGEPFWIRLVIFYS